MRIYVTLDMEGVTGVVSPEQVTPGGPEYQAARRLLMHDLDAVLIGAVGAGCTEAMVYDAHAAGRNVDVRSLDKRASLVAGKPQAEDGARFGLDDSFDALFLVGFHARAGVPDALLPHTYQDGIERITLNSTEVGEIGMEAALAGDLGVPVALVSADSAGVREARQLLGDDLEAVEVKRAVTATSGVCLPAARTAVLLRDAAARAATRARRMPPLVFPSPVRLEVSFTTAEPAEALEGAPGVERIGPRGVAAEGPNVTAAYAIFLAARRGGGAAQQRPQPEDSSPSAPS